MHGFAIDSEVYRKFLWIAVTLTLVGDVIAWWAIYATNVPYSTLNILMSAVGVGLRVAILIFLSIRKGPLDFLLYTWGGLYIISGTLGLLSYIISPDSHTVLQYAERAFFLILGILIVAPVEEKIRLSE